MPSYFFDSSAVVKRYHQEPGSPWVQSVCAPRRHATLYLSEIARVEVIAALRRLERQPNVRRSFVDSLVNAFARHLALSMPGRTMSAYHLVPVVTPVLELAANLCNHYWDLRPYPLRSLDAIQLASALAVAATLPEELIMVTSDLRLAAIAQAEGVRIANPERPPSA
ncbi:MAG: type II toxin-antitoxin system VapC family toxin [Ktedonobacterales bacterium]|nr:type II toxin-antitoxin system VapC family toxin [Ktedonobacterales bacterium]